MNAMPGTTTIDNRVSSVSFDSNKPITFKKKSMYPTQYNDISNNARLKDICQAFIDAGYDAVVKKNTVPYSSDTKLVCDYFYVYVEEKLFLEVAQKQNAKLIKEYEETVARFTEKLEKIKADQIIVEARLSWFPTLKV